MTNLTQRDFIKFGIENAIEQDNELMKKKGEEMLATLDRKASNSKSSKNKPIRDKIYNYLVENVGKFFSKEDLAEVVNVTPNQVSGFMNKVIAEHSEITKSKLKHEGFENPTVHYGIVEVAE